MNHEAQKPREELVIDILRRAGYKYTKPRRCVIQVLLESAKHLSTPEVVEKVDQIDPSVGRMTVYRTLDLFTRLGIVRPAFQGGSSARYVVMFGGHHHHIVCQGCGAVVHFDDCPLDDLQHLLETKYGYHMNGHLLEFFGYCAACFQSVN